MPFLEGTIIIIVLYVAESYYETMGAILTNTIIYCLFIIQDRPMVV